MAPKKYTLPPPWARRQSTYGLSPQTSTSKHDDPAIVSPSDDKLDRAVKELASWWKNDLSDEEYYPRVQRIIDVCHALPPGYEQCRKFQAKFRSFGATQEHVDAVLEDFEPHWTQAILTHVAKTATSPHGVASIIRIVLAETERLHGPVIDQASHEDLIRVVNCFDPPPPVIPSLSSRRRSLLSRQRPQLHVDVNVSERKPEDMFISPSSAASSVTQKHSPPETSIVSGRKPSSTFRLDQEPDPRRGSDSQLQRMSMPGSRSISVSSHTETASLSGMSEGAEKRRDSGRAVEERDGYRTTERGRGRERQTAPDRSILSMPVPDRLAPDRPVPDRPRAYREREAANIPRDERGIKRKFPFNQDEDEHSRDGHGPTATRQPYKQGETPSQLRHEAKIHLPSHLIDKYPAHIRDEIDMCCERAGLCFRSTRPLAHGIWTLEFDSQFEQRQAIGQSLFFYQKSTIVQMASYSPDQRNLQILVANIPVHVTADVEALRAIARKFTRCKFALMLQNYPQRHVLKWIICLETPINSDILHIDIKKEVCTFYGLPSDTERCFVCDAPHSCLVCNRTTRCAKNFTKDCPQYLEHLPSLVSKEFVR